MPNIQLADNLRFLRKEKGLSQQEMDEVLNLSRQAYSKLLDLILQLLPVLCQNLSFIPVLLSKRL